VSVLNIVPSRGILHKGLTIHHQRPQHFLLPTSRHQISVSEQLRRFAPPEIFVDAVLLVHSPANQQILIFYGQQQFGSEFTRDSGKRESNQKHKTESMFRLRIYNNV
jgi:hypothetical protein